MKRTSTCLLVSLLILQFQDEKFCRGFVTQHLPMKSTSASASSSTAASPPPPAIRIQSTSLGISSQRRPSSYELPPLLNTGAQSSTPPPPPELPRQYFYSQQPPQASASSSSSTSTASSATDYLYATSSTPPLPSSFHHNQNNKIQTGLPSAPGWKDSQRLNSLTEWATTETPNRPIIDVFEPSAAWLWTRWDGTVLSLTIVPVLATMGVALGVCTGLREFPGVVDVSTLQGLHSLWGYQLTLCTFLLTFFTSQSYQHWRNVYGCTRAMQGRINDLCVLVTIGAARQGETYSDEAQVLVDTTTRLMRLSHTFFWAATPTVSDGMGDDGDDGDIGSSISPLLLTKQGLSKLVKEGQLSQPEMESLLATQLPPSQYAYVLLEWVGLYVQQGLEEGTLQQGNNNQGLQENLLRQLTMLRGEYFNIGDYMAGRMPLAYVQLVQVLVDSLVYLSPFALVSEAGLLSIPLAGLLTWFYKGLLELSKSFLDPFGLNSIGKKHHGSQHIRVDVLISELNFGAASRWVAAGQHLPPLSTTDEKKEIDD